MESEEVSNALVVKPGENMRLATDVAGVCRDIVKKTAINIKGRHYVKVEGWQSIAAAHGCTIGTRDVERIPTGFRAIAELRRTDTGQVISTAEGFVGDDEKMWQSRNEFAKRAMAQTRAISRVGRSAFAHVVVLIDSDLSTTPAEEMDDNGSEVQKTVPHPHRPSDPAPSFREVKRTMDGDSWRDAVCTYGKTDGPLRGKQLGELTDGQLQYLYELFVDDKNERYLKTQKPADKPMRTALIEWKVWQREQKFKEAEAKQQFEKARAEASELDPNDEILYGDEPPVEAS